MTSHARALLLVAFALPAALATMPVSIALAQTPAPSAAAPAASSGSVGSPVEPPPAPPSAAGSAAPIVTYATCIEHLPPGATRPKLTEAFPARGLAGYALPLEITVEHGAGETVLPQGFALRDDAAGLSDLRKAGFVFPSQTGGSPARVEPMSVDGGARTKVTIPVLALPKEAGSKELTLPPLPVSVSRASGEIMTLCTSLHTVRVDDPTANVPVAAAKPKANPTGRRQLEDWAGARYATYAAGIGLVGLALGALLARWWRSRPIVLPPPPPPRPPWEIALSELAALRQGPLLEQDKLADYIDALSDIARRYLGARYGFDGVESTSREIRKALRAVVPPPPVLPDIEILLDESDLVKFARVSPSLHDCTGLSDRVETIIRETIPLLAPSPSDATQVPLVSAASAGPTRSR